MPWMVLQVLGGAFGGQPVAISNLGKNKRRKLQKPTRDKSKDIPSPPVSLSMSLAPPVLSLDRNHDAVMTAEAARRETQPPQPRDTTSAIRGRATPLAEGEIEIDIEREIERGIEIEREIDQIINHINHINRSAHSLSIYSFDDMAIDILKRTRAKTPCFWVGQLDHHRQPCDDNRYDSAVALACEYQAVLPPRTFTPGLEPQPLGRTIRKVKGRQSLREIVERDERDSVYSNAQSSSDGYDYNDNYNYNHSYNHNYNHNHNHNHSYTSDSDTLVGSDSPPFPTTPRSGYFPRPKSPLFPFVDDAKAIPHARDSCVKDSSSTSLGFQICLDLLTEQLATGLFKKHPAEHLDRASGLQIQLMIEAYESVLLHTRGEIAARHVAGLRPSHLLDLEQTLDHWVRALYSVYDRTRTKSNGSTASFRSCRSSFSSSITLQSLPAED